MTSVSVGWAESVNLPTFRNIIQHFSLFFVHVPILGRPSQLHGYRGSLSLAATDAANLRVA